MSLRDKHSFQFLGKVIADAANEEFKYHTERAAFWNEEYVKAIAEAKSAGITINEYAVTGGMRADIIIDPSVGGRVNESMGKRQTHQDKADKFRIEAASYGTQPERMYEIDGADVVHWRLAGGARD